MKRARLQETKACIFIQTAVSYPNSDIINERWEAQPRMILLFINQVTMVNFNFGNPSLVGLVKIGKTRQINKNK